MALLSIVSPSDAELRLDHRLGSFASSDIADYDRFDSAAEGDEALMMAQLVPHQSTEKRRVKVYELRNNDWFDRGTGFCCAMVSIVSRHSRALEAPAIRCAVGDCIAGAAATVCFAADCEC